jgi:hypothetical protein
MEIFSKLVTIFALVFGVWAYFFSVKPVFDKEELLSAQTRRAESLQGQVDQLAGERSKLQQRLDRLQSFTARHGKGSVLAHLAEIRRAIERDALTYQGLAPVGFDLRDYSLAWAAARLKQLDQPQRGSAGAYEKTALEYFVGFVDRRVPGGTGDVRWLAPLLDTYDKESRAGAP